MPHKRHLKRKGEERDTPFFAKSPPSYCKRHKTQYPSAHRHKNHTGERIRDRNYKILLTPFPVPPLPPRIAHSTIKLYTFFPVPSFASNFKSVFFFSFLFFPPTIMREKERGGKYVCACILKKFMHAAVVADVPTCGNNFFKLLCIEIRVEI